MRKTERHDSRKKDTEDKMGKIDKDYHHRGRETEISCKCTLERINENHLMRKDWSQLSANHEKKEKDRHGSDGYYHDTGQHLEQHKGWSKLERWMGTELSNWVHLQR